MAPNHAHADVLPAQDAGIIARWAQLHPVDTRIDLVRVPDHPALPALERFTQGLGDLIPSLRIRRETEAEARMPGLRLRPNLIFHAAPTGTEIDPFLSALALTAGAAPSPVTADQAAALARIGLPAQLDLYIGAHCPFCPGVVASLSAMAVAASPVSLAVIDAQLFAENAQTQNIQSVPTLILDGGLRWTGAVGLEALLPALVDRDPARLPPASLERMLDSGGAGELAEMMAAAGRIFPALVDLLLHPSFSVRLGAMVTMETLAELNADLALDFAAPLAGRYMNQPSNVRGDVLQVLGMVGGAETVRQIAALTEGETDPEVLAAAEEAAAEILARQSG